MKVQLHTISKSRIRVKDQKPRINEEIKGKVITFELIIISFHPVNLVFSLKRRRQSKRDYNNTHLRI